MPLEKSSINASAEIISKPSAAYTTRAKLANIIRREKLTPQTSRKKTRYGLKPLDSSGLREDPSEIRISDVMASYFVRLKRLSVWHTQLRLGVNEMS